MIRRLYCRCCLPHLFIVPPTVVGLYQYQRHYYHHRADLIPLAQPVGLQPQTIDGQLVVVVPLLYYSHPHSMRLLLLMFILLIPHRHPRPRLYCVELPGIFRLLSYLSLSSIPCSSFSLFSVGVSYNSSS